MEARDISGEHLEQLFEKYIDKGQPVLIWITSNDLSEPYKAEQWVTADGKKVQWLRNEHCVVLMFQTLWSGTRVMTMTSWL